MNNYKVTLKNADGEKCYITIYDCDSMQSAKEEAEIQAAIEEETNALNESSEAPVSEAAQGEQA